MESVVHFEIHVTDPERTFTFYTALSGWEIKKWNNPSLEYWAVVTKPKEGESKWGEYQRRYRPTSRSGSER